MTTIARAMWIVEMGGTTTAVCGVHLNHLVPTLNHAGIEHEVFLFPKDEPSMSCHACWLAEHGDLPPEHLH
jgi:hypothetical protein